MTVFALFLATILGSGPATGPVTITTTDANQWAGIDVHVVGSSEQRVRVEQEAIKGDASMVAATLTKVGKTTVVTADYRGPRSSTFFGLLRHNSGIRVRWTVYVPAGSALKIRASNDELDIAGVTAPIDANTSNGEISIVGAGSHVIGHTSNGDVHVKIATLSAGAPEVTLHTNNGDIVLGVPSGFDAKVDARTSNGDIHNPFGAATGPGSVTLRTNNGDIKVSVGQ